MIGDVHFHLRPATLADRENIYHWMASSDLTSWMMGPPHFPDTPIPSWEEFLEDYDASYFDGDLRSGHCFIIVKEGIEVGQINSAPPMADGLVELDIWLSNSSEVGKGSGVKAINLLVKHLDSELGQNRFLLAPSARNKGAIRAYEKCGFRTHPEPPTEAIPDYDDTVFMILQV